MTQQILNSPADTLAWQRERIQKADYELIGRAWVIVLEASAGAAVPGKSVTNALGSRLEFYGHDRRGKDLMPRIAQTRDRSTLLLLDPIVRADGAVGLADIPDPEYIPPVPTADELTGKDTYTPPATPMLQQRLGDRARGKLKGTNYLVFGPVMQVLIRPEGLPEGWIAECGGEKGAGTQMELLIDQSTGESFFYGGRFRISRVG